MSFEDFLHPYLGRYSQIPQWIRWGVGIAYRSLPMSLRHGARYSEYAREATLRDAASIAVTARERLAQTLQWAAQTVPAFRQSGDDHAGPEEPVQWLQHFPLTDKTSIKNDTERYLSTAISPRFRLPMFTGGSTANPMAFFLHKGVSRPKEAAYIADFDRRAGLTGKEIILNLRGRSVASLGSAHGRFWSYEPIRRHLILSSDHLEPRYMPQYVEALRTWKPAAIQAFPSALYPLARWLAEHPAPDVVDRVRSIQLTSESVFDSQLEVIREVFSCPILVHYGHSERVLMACNMPDDERYFFWPLYGHLELVDANGKPISEPGIPGEIVGTSFDNLVMPFIRYRTGDIGAWSSHGAHPALPGFPVIEKIEGRIQEFVVCRDHRVVSITTLGAAHFSEIALAEEMQYEQHAPGKLIIKLVTRSAPGEEWLQHVRRAVEAKTQHGCDVEVRLVDCIERSARGKKRLLLQHLDLSDYFGASHPARLNVLPLPTASGAAPSKRLVMVGTARCGAGGIASVISAYADHGLFERWPTSVLESHLDGSKWSKWRTFLFTLLRFTMLAAEGHVGLLHLHASSGGSFWRKTGLACVGFLFRIPVVLHVHSGGFLSFYHDKCGAIGRRLIRFVFSRCARVIALSPSWMERFRTFAPTARYECIPNPVIVKAGYPRFLQRQSVVFLGKLCPEKGVYDLVAAWRIVHTRLPDARLILGGSGETEQVEVKIAALGLQGVIELPGWVAGADKERLLSEATVFVLPSYFEGMPMSLLEAFGNGIPCVASNVGGIPDMMADGREGRLVSPGDVVGLAQALIDVLCDADRYAQMSRSVLETFQARFSADKVIPDLERLYAELGLKTIRRGHSTAQGNVT